MKGSSSLLYSKEGVTQGDPLSMFVYAIGTTPLIRAIDHPSGGVQIWYADNSSACAPLSSLEEWLRKLMEVGPQFGYHPEPRKSFLVVKDNMISEAHDLFDGLGVSIVTSRQYLGGFIGPHEEQLDFVKSSVVKWISTLDSLIAVAKDQLLQDHSRISGYTFRGLYQTVPLVLMIWNIKWLLNYYLPYLAVKCHLGRE